MTQNDLNRAVARQTEETVGTISHRGFGPLSPLSPEPDAEDLILDWDHVHASRNVALFPQPGRLKTAVCDQR
jgi:hypothetical protein